MGGKEKLTIEKLIQEAQCFCVEQSKIQHKELYGVTDGKAVIGYLQDKNVPADDITLSEIAKQILKTPPEQGYLTISNALQWRLQYQRIVSLTEDIPGVEKIIAYNNPE